MSVFSIAMKNSVLPVLRLTAVALTAILALAGCSSTPPLQVDAGPVRVGSFNFVNSKASAQAARDERRQAVHGMIQAAIAENLTARGFQRTPGRGDITVAYLVVVGNGAATAVFDDYFGLGREGGEIGAAVHERQSGLGGPNYSEAGTLVIDLLDSNTLKLLKRATVVRPVLRNAPAEIRKEHLEQAVADALQGLQVSK
jgi:hypothetical protein